MTGRLRGLLLALAAGAALAAPPLVLDRFETVQAWKAVPSDGVLLALGGAGSLRMDFDFQGRGGYAAARRSLPLTLPPNYEITFEVRGDCPPENLEFKLVDPSGENVWWVRKPAFAFPKAWTRVTLKKRQVTFAWGPGGADPARIASIEWCVTAGSGGKGHAEFRDLAIRELPVDVPTGGDLERIIGFHVRRLRLSEGLGVAEMAQRIGISKAMLSKIENAQTSCSLSMLAK